MGKRKSNSEPFAKFTEPVVESLETQRKIRRAQAATEDARRQLNEAVKVIEQLEAERDVLLGLSDRENVEAWSRPVKVDKGEAAALLVVSDVHLAEVVRKSQVLGLNEFSCRTCEKRMQQVAVRSIDLLKKERVLADIREGIIFLGGDIIGGHIHSELMETSEIGIASAVELAEELLERLIRSYWNAGKFDRLTVVCLSGNHDRMTQRVSHAAFVENSHTTAIYRHLRFRFRPEHPQIQFLLGDGEYADVPVFGWNIRLTHGHRVKFAGGVGGLSIPWSKHVTRLNKGKPADFTIGGHLHTWTYNSEMGFLVNGSVIGTTPYSLPYGHQEPCQSFVVIDKKRCVTQCSKVFCTD